MLFTAEKKAELVAFIETLDPSEDTTALRERIVELEDVVARQNAALISARAALADLQAALA